MRWDPFLLGMCLMQILYAYMVKFGYANHAFGLFWVAWALGGFDQIIKDRCRLTDDDQ